MSAKNIFFLLLAATIILTGCPGTVEAAGEKAQDFSLKDINNRIVRLSDYGNKVIILNFFATWCPPCKSEIPDFVELVKEYGDKGLVIIGVSVDNGDMETIKNFAAQYNINYPILLDDGLVSNAYGPIQGIPATFIIDKKGRIVQKIVGARSKSQFENIVKPLL